MKKLLIHLISITALVLLADNSVFAASYPATIGLELPLNVPKFNALTSTFPTSKGAVALDLQFAYTGANKFACAGASVVDGEPATCAGVQSGAKYSLSIKAVGTRITLNGAIAAIPVSATYKGPKGKLTLRKISVVPQYTAAPISSVVVLKPTTNSAGKLVNSTGHIKSGYNGLLADVVLTGSVKRNVVNWSLKYQGNKLSFAGKEKNNAWTGKLTGNIGPAKIAKTVTIPLTEYSVGSASEARFYGAISSSDGKAQPEKASGVSVSIRSDRNANGSIEADEAVTAVTDTDGKFDKQFAVLEGHPVMVDFDLDGHSKTPKVFASVSAGAEVPINTTLRKLDTLSVSGAKANSTDGKLQLENLPANVQSISGKVFNPVQETAQFPGEFADNTGNMLISSVFSAIEAKDANGNPVTELSSATLLKMQVPKDTWNTLGDLVAANNQIDVPLYYYDEATGEWKRSDSNGWLVDEAGAKLAESALSGLKNGSFTGNVYAAGNIAHLSYWNIDWPIETHGCVAGRLVDSLGNPVADAVVTASGTTYTGTSSPLTTSSSGRFCIDVMRSEAAGEDLNNNGIPGEQSQIAFTVFSNGKYYKFGPYTVPPTPATCSTSGCLELGDIKLEADKEVALTICTISGRVVYSGIAATGSTDTVKGAAIPGALVFAYDTASTTDFTSCYLNGSCSLFVQTDSSGNFELKVPILFGAELWTYSFNTNYFIGTMTVNGCPKDPLEIGADFYGSF